MVTVKQAAANLWRFHDAGWYVVVPTNCYVKSDRKNVMGRGLASQLVTKFPEAPSYYGELLLGFTRSRLGPGKEPQIKSLNKFELIQVHFDWKVIFWPVKLMWDAPADPELIKMGLEDFKTWLDQNPGVQKIAIPRLGCGNGKLDWETQVKPLLRDFLTDLDSETRSRLAICHPPEYLTGFGVE